MKRLVLLFIVLFKSFQYSHAQGSIITSQQEFIYTLDRDSSIDNRIRASSDAQLMTKVEKEALYWINYVRTKPRDFLDHILKPFIQQFPETKGPYSNSLIKTLEQMAPVPFIEPDKQLNTLALSHSSDLGKSGSSISHSSSRGESFQQRMTKAGFTNCIAENVYEGRQQALQSILFLLIDKGVPNVGHRKNILDPSMHSIGLSFYPIKGKTGYFFQVQNFSCASTQ